MIVATHITISEGGAWLLLSKHNPVKKETYEKVDERHRQFFSFDYKHPKLPNLMKAQPNAVLFSDGSIWSNRNMTWSWRNS